MTPKNVLNTILQGALVAALLFTSAIASAIPSYSTENARRVADEVLGTKAVTCAADGTGAAAACTLLFYGVRNISYTCADTDTCAITMSELNVYDGATVVITNVGSNSITFADSNGVQDLTSGTSYTCTTAQSLVMVYKTNHWVEVSRSSIPGTGPITFADGESVSSGVDGTITMGRDTSGVVTVTAADDNAVAALTILPGGAAPFTLGGATTQGLTIKDDGTGITLNRATTGTVTVSATDDDANAILALRGGGAGSVVVGNASNTSVTITTDGTGNAELVVPNGSIGVAELTRPGHWTFQVCGDATTVNNNTVYYGPTMAITSSATVAMRTCDTTAVGNVTEATADEPVLTGTAFGITDMVCTSANPGGAAGLTFTLRSAAAGITPAVACTIVNGAAGSCVANVQSTVDVASAATIAVAVSSTDNVGAVPFICQVNVVF